MFQVPTVSVLGVHGRGLWVSQELWGGPYVCFRLIWGGGGQSRFYVTQEGS